MIRLGAAWMMLLVAFASDWWAMAQQWWNISTYNHVILIPAILAWQAWQRAPELARLRPIPWWPGLVAFGMAAAVWLLGALSGLDLARQAGAVGMLGATIPALLGIRPTAALLFPLCYLAFLVPVGEELVKPLQTITAGITIALTRFSGIPATIEGVFIDTPAGLFEVAEACSGVKFLIAMFAFGVLAANVCYRSWMRRVVLLAACVVVPVLANGVRAWGTIYAAQIVGAEKASGIDHIVYGWIFFAVVLALVIAGAWRFFDRAPGSPLVDGEAIGRDPRWDRLEALRIPAGRAIMVVAVLLVVVRGGAGSADAMMAQVPGQITLPMVRGWERVDYVPRIWWEPRAAGADHRLLGRYRDSAGRQVDVFIAVYARQGEGQEAGGFGQGALIPDSLWSWQSAAPAFDGGHGERLLGDGTVERVAVTWYRNGDLLSGSNVKLKLAVIGNKLTLRSRPTITLILSAEDSSRGDAPSAIRHFRASTGPLGAWMDRIAQVR